jgi:Fe-S-cluster containining protein
MSILLDGIGDGWIVTRRTVGGKPELVTFSSLEELRRGVVRLLVRADQPLGAVTEVPITAPVARPLPVVAHSVGLVPRATETKSSTAPLDLTDQDDHYEPVVAAELDCRVCGACCGPIDQRRDTHVALEPEDVAQIPPTMLGSLVVKDGGAPFLGTKRDPNGKTVCKAFGGVIGGQCKCNIYTKRPMVCRIFEKGSSECLEARLAFGVR